MFMPGLGPDALGWDVHLDFARAVESLGHEFRLVTTPAPQPSRTSATKPDPPGNGPESTRKLRATPATGGSSSPARSDAREPARDTREPGVGSPRPDPSITVLPELPADRRWTAAARPLLRTGQLLPAAAAFTRYLDENGGDIDLLHFEVAYPHAAAGTLAAKRSRWRGPIAVTPMGEDVLVVPDRSYGMRRYPVPAAMVKRTLRRAAALRCISPMFEQHISALSPHNPRRVIPLNVSTAVARAANTTAAERDAYRRAARASVDEDFGTAGRPLVLSFGRLHPFKGIDLLVDAAAGIGDATILVIGPSLKVRPFGDVAATLRRRADQQGVRHKVNVAGGVPPARALELLAAADVVVVPSPLESLNKVCMEAAAVGTPFIVTETTGVSAWVPREGVGIVIPPRNVATLSWAIEEIVDGHFKVDPEALRQFARQFTPERIAAQVMDFYEATFGTG